MTAPPAHPDGSVAAISGRSRKAFWQGTHRTASPAQTVARVKQMFPAFGITRVANVTGLDLIGIPVVMVCRPNSRSVAVSQGKGVDLEAARASGVMEAIELFHAERILNPLKLAAYNELRLGHRVAPVEALPRVSVRPFHPNRAILWIEGADLTRGDTAWVPYELVHANFTMPFPPGSGAFVMSSNGLASGNDWSEALAHGIGELIERDATTLFHCRSNAARQTLRLDLQSVTDPDARRMLELYEAAEVAVAVWDVTSDVGIPAFRCCILDRGSRGLRHVPPAEGMGCHPTREVALLRALTEAAQARLTIIAGSRDDNGRRRYEELQDDQLASRVQDEMTQPGRRSFQSIGSVLHDTSEEDVAWILASLERAGLSQVIAVDLTRRELGIAVVRVIVPGLESYHHVQGYRPGKRAARILESNTEEAGA